MAWLNENWIWLLVVVGGLVLMTRMNGMGMGCGMAHTRDRPRHGGSEPEGRDLSRPVGDPQAGSHRHHGCC
jgi:hypothetical protein